MADSIWPRTGGDRTNRSCSPVEGPTRGRVLSSVAIDAEPPAVIVVAEDGSLVVSSSGALLSVGRWRVPLKKCKSGPVALEGGATLLPLGHELVWFDAEGHETGRVDCGFPLDDSGPSPNIGWDGAPIVTSPLGDVGIVRGGVCREIGAFGYDILPPALYPDGSLAIAGYYGRGFCRVTPEGKVQKLGLKQADMLPTISRDQVAAVGSLNNGQSRFYSPEGQEIGRYHAACCFAEHPAGGWVALAKGGVARLCPVGRELWHRPLQCAPVWGLMQPVVDPAGHIYVPVVDGVVCLDAGGKEVFHLPVEGVAGPLTPVKPGVLAVVAAAGLVRIG